MYAPIYFKVTKGLDNVELKEILLDIGLLGSVIGRRDMQEILATLEDEYGFDVRDFGSWIRCNNRELGIYLDFVDLEEVDFSDDLKRAFRSWVGSDRVVLMEIEGDFLATYIPVKFRGRIEKSEEGFVIDVRDVGLLFDLLFEINRSPDTRVLKKTGAYEGYTDLRGKEIGFGRKRLNGFIEFGFEYLYEVRRDFQVIIRYLDIIEWIEERIIFAGL